MKKEERLHRLFGDIDDDLVADAANRPIPLKVWLPRVTAAVAAVALVVGLTLTLPWMHEKPPVTTDTNGGDGHGTTTTTPIRQDTPNGTEGGAPIASEPDHVAPPKPTGGTSTTAATNSEIWYEPKWEDKTNWQRYSEFERFEKGTYTVREVQVDAAKVGEYLQDVNLHGYDVYTDTPYDTTGKIYRIQGINDGCAVALQYLGEDKFYPAVCSKYTPATLGQFLADLNLRNTMTVGTVYGKYVDEQQGHIRSAEYEGLTTEAVWNLLLQVTDATNEYNYEKVIEADGSMDISIGIPMLSIYNVSLRVTVDGYLFTNLMDTGKIFYIGEEATTHFMDYVRNNCRVVYDEAPLHDTTTVPIAMPTGTSAAQPPLVTGTTVWKDDPV